MESLSSAFSSELYVEDGRMLDPGIADNSVELKGIDLHIKTNSSNHRTNSFILTSCGEDACLVVRRGQVFKISFAFNGAINWTTDHVNVVFTSQGISDGKNEIFIPITGEVSTVDNLQLLENGWASVVTYNSNSIVSVMVKPPPHAPVGIYRTRLEMVNTERHLTNSISVQELIYMLFNPWNPEDVVFMPDEVLRNEYILNEYGKVYQGTYDFPVGKTWHYGQFDCIVLPTIGYLIDLGKLTVDELRCPISLTRHISALVDQTDDVGILKGRWDGDYCDGVSPMTWSSSVSIMEMYMRRGGAPVFYGQCWVYAGVVTSLCRAIGIPCRPVTNFESAHDTDGNMNIDSFSDENGTPIEEANKDSSWNFHLWNECWMRRPDLGSEFDGWQAFDGTPQEQSDGRYRLGPCSVRAIQSGRVDLNYDTKFVFAETNALFYDWVRDRSEPSGWKVLTTDREAGMLILTKDPTAFVEGDSVEDAIDITASYKCNNPDARLQLQRQGELSSSEDVKYELVKVKRIKTGDKFDVVLNIKNFSGLPRTVDTAISVATLEYTGLISKYVKRQKITGIHIPPMGSSSCTLPVELQDYQDKITNFGLLKVMVGSKALETQKTWAGQFTTKMEMPKISVSAQRNPSVESEIIYCVSFANPLLISLTCCELVVNIPGISNHQVIRGLANIGPKENFKWCGTAISTRVDKKSFLITFNSKQLFALEGTHSAIL